MQPVTGPGGHEYPGCDVREAAVLFARYCQLTPLASPLADLSPPYEGEIPDVDAEDEY